MVRSCGEQMATKKRVLRTYSYVSYLGVLGVPQAGGFNANQQHSRACCWPKFVLIVQNVGIHETHEVVQCNSSVHVSIKY